MLSHLSSLCNDAIYTVRDPLASITDVVERPVLGPSLCIGEHTLTWEGPPSDTVDMTPNGELVRLISECHDIVLLPH